MERLLFSLRGFGGAALQAFSVPTTSGLCNVYPDRWAEFGAAGRVFSAPSTALICNTSLPLVEFGGTSRTCTHGLPQLGFWCHRMDLQCCPALGNAGLFYVLRHRGWCSSRLRSAFAGLRSRLVSASIL